MLPIFYDDAFLLHDTGFYHPENSGRLQAVTQALKSVDWSNQLDWRSPTAVDQQGDRLLNALHAVHPPRYTQAVRELANRGGGHLDPDTVVSPLSYEVALLAVSAWLDGVDQVLQSGKPAFALVRPPGHHALSDHGMGFCLFSNAAIAAQYALNRSDVQRVAILDWDVHHGNGTQAIVEDNPQIAYCSLHQFPFYPGTGSAKETGAHHNVLNIPMTSGSQGEEYQTVFQAAVVPFLNRFQPDLILVSAGYDANKEDPLSNISLKPEDFEWMTEAVLSITHRVLFGLEGGYDYTTLSQSIVATLSACLTVV